MKDGGRHKEGGRAWLVSLMAADKPCPQLKPFIIVIELIDQGILKVKTFGGDKPMWWAKSAPHDWVLYPPKRCGGPRG